MNKIMIGDWYLTFGDLAIVLLFMGGVAVVLAAVNRRWRAQIDALLVGDSGKTQALKMVALLALNLLLYLLRSVFQLQANSHLEPLGGEFVALAFIPMAAGVFHKMLILRSQIIRKPLSLTLCFLIMGTFIIRAYQYLTLDCEFCGLEV